MKLASALILAAAAAQSDDPFLWLEEVDGARAMEWVKAENQKTLSALEADSRHAKLYAEALAIAESKDRLPMPSFIAGGIYNF